MARSRSHRRPRRRPAEADLLASLPAHLLDEILTRLDLRDTVRTSALSRAWRRRWESLPMLALSFPKGTAPSVVDSVLRRYTGPRVSRFSFVGDGDVASACRFDDWLVVLSRRGVESISFSSGSCGYNYISLHSSIFSCASLVSLDLYGCSMPLLPVGFTGFPVLEELKLRRVNFPGNMEKRLQAIIRGSPLLRVLYLEDLETFWECNTVIEAPNLRSLTLWSTHDDWLFGELPCLQDANIFVHEYLDDFRNFLVGFAQVRELTLCPPGDDLEIPDTLPVNFYNLKSLKLLTRLSRMPPILFMFCVLRSSPNLVKLEIEIEIWGTEYYEDIDWEFLNAQWTDGMCTNLQDVQIINMNSFPEEISFIKLILCKAKLLRTLSMDACPASQHDPLKELLECRRASAQSEVLFKGSVGEQ